MKQVKSGDVNAYSVLVKRYEVSVRAFLIVRLSEPHEAEDLAQETFILAYNKITDFEEDRSFGAWLRGIAFNLYKNHIRKHKPIAVGSDTELDDLIKNEIDQHYNQSNESASLDALRHCLKKLNTKMQTLMTDHYVEGFSMSEMTEKYQVKHSAMTMQMFRIRKRLKDCIDSSIEGFKS
nr:sigma-70 family RNA polymerase sigma factor [Paraglaciecola sp. L3A3]